MIITGLSTTFTVAANASENEKKIAREATQVTTQLLRLIEQQKSIIDQQEQLLASQAATIADHESRITTLEP